MEETPYPKGLKLRMFKNSENFSSRADAINFKFFIHFLFIFYSFFIHFYHSANFKMISTKTSK